MRVGMYNRWFATLGGGENHSLAIAEYISQRHPVTMISHEPVRKDVVADWFHMDLSNVTFKCVPMCSPHRITQLTTQYDLFINASHNTFFASRASVSAILIYFPAALSTPWQQSLRWRLKMALRQWLLLPECISGLRQIEAGRTSFSWLAGSDLCIRLPGNPNGYEINFVLHTPDKVTNKATILLNGKELGTIPLSNREFFQLSIPGTQRSYHELIIQAAGDLDSYDQSTRLVVSDFELTLPQHKLYRLLFERAFKQQGIRLYYDLPKSWILDYLATYDVIWANSKFTRGWIRQYWGHDAEVLYAPVNTHNFRVSEKRNQILSVGRFFTKRHNKKHLVMVQAFKEMVDDGLTHWELHLAGGMMHGFAHQAYLQQIYEESKGYPIFIHVDLPFNRLIDLYGRSKIYWHAAGYGEDEEREPGKFEHFGITTVEAMASGCVPVVIGKGGQPEIVKHGQNGFLWETIDELKSLTSNLIRQPDLLAEISQLVIRDCQRFDKTHFQIRLRETLEQISCL